MSYMDRHASEVEYSQLKSRKYKIAVDISLGMPRDTAYVSGKCVNHLSELLEMEMFDSINNWTRGNRVGPHGSDIGLAWDLGTLDPGEYTIEITMTEEGSPWVNITELTYTISIAQTTVLD